MISFSYRNFKEHLTEPLKQIEIQFLLRTFSYACAYFFTFGIFVFASSVLLSKVISLGWALTAMCSFIGILLYFPLSFLSLKYRNNPLRASSSFVATIFTFLTFCFMFMFLGLSNIFFSLLKGSDSVEVGDIGYSLLLIFGITIFIYLIPAALALYISNRSTIVSLNRFLNFCYIFYIALFVVTLLIAIFGFHLSKVIHIVLLLIISLMLFVSPIITIYRMKTIAPYINYEDPYERKRWENYFAFEISFQLLQLAFHVLRIAVMLLSTTSRSRLK